MSEALAINLDSPCWLWTRAKTKGYGTLWSNGKQIYAHRYMWTVMRGPIPEGMELDHLCRVTACINPQHLEVVTHRENCLRGLSPTAEAARKTHCPQGHPYSPENTYARGYGRVCRTCNLQRKRDKWHELHPDAPYRPRTPYHAKYRTSP